MQNLTPRENFIRFYKGEPYAWTPTDRDQKLFSPALLPENVARGKVAQKNAYDPKSYGGKDWFGVEWGYDPAVRGSIEVAPLMDEIDGWEEKVVFPDLSALDWAGCVEENKEYLQTDRILATTIYSGFFERLISFVGFENAAMALIDEEEQDTVKTLFDRLADFYIEQIQYMHRYFNIEHVEVHDDWGTQRGPIFSVDTHEEMIVPYIKKMVDGAHKEGVFIEIHSCGMIEPLIPGLIRTGADTWCGQVLNDKLALVKKYGDQFKFCIGMPKMPTASDDEVREYARQLKADYKGKEVWYMAGKGLTPTQAQIVYDIICNGE